MDCRLRALPCTDSAIFPLFSTVEMMAVERSAGAPCASLARFRPEFSLDYHSTSTLRPNAIHIWNKSFRIDDCGNKSESQPIFSSRDGDRDVLLGCTLQMISRE